MEKARQIELINSWGFNPASHDDTLYLRNAPNGYLEVWSINAPNYIDFHDSNGKMTESHEIHWNIINKHFN